MGCVVHVCPLLRGLVLDSELRTMTLPPSSGVTPSAAASRSNVQSWTATQTSGFS
eukprot:m.56101 g.56101  ORF g.56101 m.56101 type:complete len:55 (+) comp12579_c0_seq2:586-750(+)